MRNKKKDFIIWGIVIVLLFFLSGCADSVTFMEAAAREPVGFWYGLWHGVTLPFSWIGSLISSNIAIYAIYNNGGWYDTGFVLGISFILGGGGSQL